LSDRPNKPCYVLTLKGVSLMLDCALDSSTLLNFMPIPLIQSAKLSQLPRYLPKDGEHNLDGVSGPTIEI
jgi:integrator complex subunit 9